MAFTLAPDLLNELGDSEMRVIRNAGLTASVLEVLSTSTTHLDLSGLLTLKPYPNPADEVVNLSYSLPVSGRVKIEAFDIAGRKMGIVVDEVQQQGAYDLPVDVSVWTPGVYFVRLNLRNNSAEVQLLEKIIIK